jgi:hypothetical protein
MTTPPRNRRVFTPRGKPFSKGNAGKPKGARHRTTVIAEKLMRDETDAIVRAVIDKAKSGDMVAAKIVLDRISPVRKGSPVHLALPAAKSASEVADAVTALIAGMAAGEITPDEAVTIGGVLELRRKAIETSEFENRLAKLEAKAGDQK